MSNYPDAKYFHYRECPQSDYSDYREDPIDEGLHRPESAECKCVEIEGDTTEMRAELGLYSPWRPPY